MGTCRRSFVRSWGAEGFFQVPGHSIFARPLRIRRVLMLWTDEGKSISAVVGRYGKVRISSLGKLGDLGERLVFRLGLTSLCFVH